MEEVRNVQKILPDYLPKIPKFKLKKRKLSVIKKQMECPERVLVLCNQLKPFYLCLNAFYDKLFNDCMLMMCPDYPCSEEKYSDCMENFGFCWSQYCDTDVDAMITNLPISQNNKGLKMIICKCKAVRSLDGDIIERKPLNDFSEFEPCKYRCREVIRTGMCLLEEKRRSPKHKSLDYYFKRFSKKRT